MNIKFLSYIIFTFLLLNNYLHAGHVRVFDITEAEDEEKHPGRIVKISFEKDPGEISLQNSISEGYATCTPVTVAWSKADDLASLLGTRAPTIVSISIEDIRNDQDLAYARLFLKKINQYTAQDVKRFLCPSHTSSQIWKNKVNALNENVRNKIDENMEDYAGDHQSFMAELNETYRKGDVDFPEDENSYFDYCSTYSSEVDYPDIDGSENSY